MKPLRSEAFADAEPLRGRGHRAPATLAALAARDRLLRETARLYFAGLSDNEAAHRLHDALARYAGGGWRRERAAEVCPARYGGRLTAHCWRILKARDATPSARSVRRILASGVDGAASR